MSKEQLVLYNDREVTVEEMWKDMHIDTEQGRAAWYQKSLDFWADKDATINGVLDGYEQVHPTDISGSKRLLRKIKALDSSAGGPPSFDVAIECGAGIGRVTKALILPAFKTVDVVEPMTSYCDYMREHLPDPRLRSIHAISLQDFKFPKKEYDVVWFQWVLLYLTDKDLIQCLKDAKESLRPRGIIVVKENVQYDGSYDSSATFDIRDNGLCRSMQNYRKLFEEAGLVEVLSLPQPMPSCAQPVYMFALR